MNDKLVLLAGNANKALARKISKYLQQPLGKLSISHFKDGEVYVRIDENVRGKDVFIVQPTSKQVNHNLMELAIIIDALKRASAARITAVMPYYGYARQDRKAKGREPITAKLVANLIVTAGADRVLTIDLHADQIQGFFDIPLDHLMGAPLIVKYLKSKKLKNIVVVAPDAGGVKKTRVVGKLLGKPLAIIDKRREKHNEVAEMNIIGNVKGKSCVIIDDMIDTAGTVSEAAKALKKAGANDVYIAATHAILSDPAVDRLKDSAIKEIILTDTIDIPKKKLISKMKVLSVSGLMAEAIERIHAEKSVSQLFEYSLEKPEQKLTNYQEEE